VNEGKAYHCYCSKEELDALREEQMARKEKPRYDGRCRHPRRTPRGRVAGGAFSQPGRREVVIEDRVKGRIVSSQ
jgi:glutamyl-tRNA synthetase